MHGTNEAAPVKLSERCREVLERIVRRQTCELRLYVRVRIVLLVSQGISNKKIAKDLGCGRKRAAHWRNAWAQESRRFEKMERENASNADLESCAADILSDVDRLGAPPKFDSHQVVKIIQLACEEPKSSGRPVDRWTPWELADEAVKRNIVDSISARTVGRILGEAAISPHKIRYWLNPPADGNPEESEAAIREVCQLYKDALELRARRINLVSIDEKTGIQALERVHPDKPPRPHQAQKVEFEYERHGTLSLFANMNVATGEIIAPTINATRTEEDMVGNIERMVATDPEAGWISIVDQLNTHKSEGLVRLVAKLEGLSIDLGVKGKRGILENMESRASFLSDPCRKIRFVYLPRHTSWMNQVEIWFSALSRRALRWGSFSSVDALRQRLLDFIAYFNDVMAKPFRWTYSGRPLQA